jgi:hypothetical protein
MAPRILRAWNSTPVQWMFSIKLTVFLLAVLMILTFWGTLYQVDHGLFAAQQKFFTSWFVWVLGVIPFPGGKLTLGLLALNLLGYMINMLAFQPLRPGIVMIHAGLLIMLIGGAITHYYGEESYLTLWEGEASNVVSSYHEWEIAVWRGDGAVREVYAIDSNHLQAGEELTFDPAPIAMRVDVYHGNARAYQSRTNTPSYLTSFNISRIEKAPPEKEPTQNTPAALVTVSSPDMEPTQVLLFGQDTAPLIIPVGEEEYAIGLRHKRRAMPLLVKLTDFKKEVYPGTQTPKGFSSDVEVQADGITRDLTISMNKPLRHRGYTLYQQSYRELPEGDEASTFAVTLNYGRLLPYVSTGIVFLGMAVHFVMMLIKHARKRVRQAPVIAGGAA